MACSPAFGNRCRCSSQWASFTPHLPARGMKGLGRGGLGAGGAILALQSPGKNEERGGGRDSLFSLAFCSAALPAPPPPLQFFFPLLGPRALLPPPPTPHPSIPGPPNLLRAFLPSHHGEKVGHD